VGSPILFRALGHCALIKVRELAKPGVDTLWVRRCRVARLNVKGRARSHTDLDCHIARALALA